MASEVIERGLYNGKYQLIHNPNARGRAPRYKVNDVNKPKGVTTILGKTLGKDLMGWAVKCYSEYLTEKLPVITAEDLVEGEKEYTRRRDAGAGTGSEAHALVENYLKHGTAPSTDASKEAKNAFDAFVTWFTGSKPEVINVEEVIYSEQFNYAGTYDCMLRIDGKVYLCDYKTTNASRKAPNGIYAEYFIQLGAYTNAHEEQRRYEEENGGTKLVPIDGAMVISCQKNGTLNICTNEDVGISIGDCMEMFRKIVNLHNFLEEITKRLGGKG